MGGLGLRLTSAAGSSDPDIVSGTLPYLECVSALVSMA